MKQSSHDLSNHEITSLLRLALKYLKGEGVFEKFDEVIGERIQSGALNTREFAEIMEAIASNNQ